MEFDLQSLDRFIETNHHVSLVKRQRDEIMSALDIESCFHILSEVSVTAND